MIVSCPIWETSAKEVAGYENRDGSAYLSPRAGGTYFLSRTAHAMIRRLAPEEKVRLTHEIVTNQMSAAVLEISSATLDQVRTSRDTPVAERASRLLKYLARMSPFLGANIFFKDSLVDDASFKGNVESGFSPWPLLAWSDSTRPAEIKFLVEMLTSDRLLDATFSSSGLHLKLLPRGYAALDEAGQNLVSDQAFVAMWFDDSMNDPFEQGLDRAIREAGYRPLRIDRKEHNNKIDDEIIAEIRRSRFLVADFTSRPESPRGGVYFEAGFAVGLGIPVIWTCRQDVIAHVHFDTRQFNHIVWDNHHELRQRLKNRILATIGAGPLTASNASRP